MFYRNEAAAVAQQWQRRIDESLEAGNGLWLELGVSNRVLDQINALTALDELAAHRTDVTTPGIFVGGDGVVWTVACMSPAVTAVGMPGPGMRLLYGGADRATYMAALATLPGPSTHTQQSTLTGLPIGIQSWLQPASQPGITSPWSALPFVMAALPGATTDNPELNNAEPASGEAWLPWIALFVVIGLVITALFV